MLGVLPGSELLGAGQPVPWWRLGVLLWVVYGGLLLALLWFVSKRWGPAVDSTCARAAELLMRPPSGLFIAIASAATTLLGICVGLYCYAGRGFSTDEMAMAWHGQMLLAGHVAVPSPAHPEFFYSVSVLMRDGRWFSQYPIGGPALLAVGLFVRAPWLISPLLLGVATWQLYRFARRAFGEPVARAATLLFPLTPMVLVLGTTQMSHAPAMMLTLVALAELAAWEADTGSPALHAAAIGLALGLMSLVRPLDAVLVALPIGAFQLARLRRDPHRIASIAIQCVAGLVPVAVLLWANLRTTGAPLLFGYEALNGPAHAWGFHVDPTGQMHSVRRGIVYAFGDSMRLNRFLFEWPLPGLLVICGVLASLRRGTRWDSVLLAMVGTFLAGYAAYWHDGFFDGPRFLFPVVPVLVLYAARAPEAAVRFAHPTRQRVARLLVPACVVCAWLVPLWFSSVPGRLESQHEQRTKLKTNVAGQAAHAGLTNALVLVHESWRGRLMARLVALGMRPFEADHVLNDTDACALQLALDEAGSDSGATGLPHRNRVLARARAAGPATLQLDADAESRIARSSHGPASPHCRDEMAADTLSTMPFAMFLREQEVGADGRLAGNVVWARDMGARDSLLRQEFGGRQWYLYKPGRSLEDAAEFVPVVRQR
ncbi:MAG: hypothetical protein ABIY52_04705 [Gemmatimonadaceae bacterium]